METGGKMTAFRRPNHCDTSSEALTCDRVAEKTQRRSLFRRRRRRRKREKSRWWRWWTSERQGGRTKRGKKKKLLLRSHNGDHTMARRPILCPAVKKRSPYSFLCRPSASLLNAKNKGRVERSTFTAADEQNV